MAGKLAPASEFNNKTQQTPGNTSAREAASSLSSGGLINNLKLAGNDYVQYWYQSHGAIYDAQMTNLDASGVKREFVGYVLIGLFVFLQLTRFGPFLANVVCIAYPVTASRNQQDATKWLVYWSLFGLLSLLDATSLALSAAYWIAKVAICIWLFLPQTQGALVVNGLVIEPAANFVAVKLSALCQ